MYAALKHIREELIPDNGNLLQLSLLMRAEGAVYQFRSSEEEIIHHIIGRIEDAVLTRVGRQEVIDEVIGGFRNRRPCFNDSFVIESNIDFLPQPLPLFSR